MLSEPAEKRLRQYCSRARFSRRDFADSGHGREARYLSADLRRIVWNDVEVRDVLLAAGGHRSAWGALLGQVGRERGLPLLDLVSAMSLEARTAASSG